jgi:hypothetical protein
MTSRPIPQCVTCVHWISPLDRTDLTAEQEGDPPQVCAGAFPPPDSVIPDEIWWNRFDHRQPYEGDHGVQWAPVTPDTPFPEWALAASIDA